MSDEMPQEPEQEADPTLDDMLSKFISKYQETYGNDPIFKDVKEVLINANQSLRIPENRYGEREYEISKALRRLEGLLDTRVKIAISSCENSLRDIYKYLSCCT